MKFAPYSYSKISTYLSCNKKFKYTYIDKAPQNKTDMTALLKGRAVHSILEHHPNTSTHKLAKKYQTVADNFIASKLGKKYLSVNSTREYRFGLTKELKPTTYNDKDALFRGFIDYVCIIDDVLYLIDWKTGKLKEPRWQTFEQLEFYSIYFFQKYHNLNKIRLSYVYVEHENAENDILLERKYLNNYVKNLITPIKEIESEVLFTKTTSKLCEWCSFIDYCMKDI